MILRIYLAVINEYTFRVFKNTVLRKIFRPKRWEVTTGGWRILQSEELQGEKALPHIIWVMISGRMRCVGHVVHMWLHQKVSNQIFFSFKQEGTWEREWGAWPWTSLHVWILRPPLIAQSIWALRIWTKKDLVIIWGGTRDIAKNESKKD